MCVAFNYQDVSDQCAGGGWAGVAETWAAKWTKCGAEWCKMLWWISTFKGNAPTRDLHGNRRVFHNVEVSFLVNMKKMLSWEWHRNLESFLLDFEVSAEVASDTNALELHCEQPNRKSDCTTTKQGRFRNALELPDYIHSRTFLEGLLTPNSHITLNVRHKNSGFVSLSPFLATAAVLWQTHLHW